MMLKSEITNIKNIIVVLSLFLSGINSSCHSQESKPVNHEEQKECSKERWVTLYKDNNKSIFHRAEGRTDPYQEIKKLLLDGEIR